MFWDTFLLSILCMHWQIYLLFLCRVNSVAFRSDHTTLSLMRESLFRWSVTILFLLIIPETNDLLGHYICAGWQCIVVIQLHRLCCTYILCKKFSDKMFNILHDIVMCVCKGCMKLGHLYCFCHHRCFCHNNNINNHHRCCCFCCCLAGAAVSVVDVHVELLLTLVIVLYIICRLFGILTSCCNL